MLLPVETLECIFSWLDEATLLNCRLLSKQCYSLASSDPVWVERVKALYTVAPSWLPTPRQITCIEYVKLRRKMDKEALALVDLISSFALVGHWYTPFNTELVLLGWSAWDVLRKSFSVRSPGSYAQRIYALAMGPGGRLLHRPLVSLDELAVAVQSEAALNTSRRARAAIARFEAAHVLFNLPANQQKSASPFGDAFDVLAALSAFSRDTVKSPLFRRCKLPPPERARETARFGFRRYLNSDGLRANELLQVRMRDLPLPSLMSSLWAELNDSLRPAVGIPDQAEDHFLTSALERMYGRYLELAYDRSFEGPASAPTLHQEGTTIVVMVIFCSFLQFSKPGTAAWLFQTGQGERAEYWLAAEDATRKDMAFFSFPRSRDEFQASRTISAEQFSRHLVEQHGPQAFHDLVNGLTWGTTDIDMLVTKFMDDLFRHNDPNDFGMEESDRALELMFVLFALWTSHRNGVAFSVDAMITLVRLIESSFPFDLPILTHVLMPLKTPDGSDAFPPELRTVVEEYVAMKRLGFKSKAASFMAKYENEWASEDPRDFLKIINDVQDTTNEQLAESFGVHLKNPSSST